MHACMYSSMLYGHHMIQVQQSMDQPGKVANPARVSWTENLGDRFDRPVPRHPARSPHSG